MIRSKTLGLYKVVLQYYVFSHEEDYSNNSSVVRPSLERNVEKSLDLFYAAWIQPVCVSYV